MVCEDSSGTSKMFSCFDRSNRAFLRNERTWLSGISNIWLDGVLWAKDLRGIFSRYSRIPKVDFSGTCLMSS